MLSKQLYLKYSGHAFIEIDSTYEHYNEFDDPEIK